MSDAPADDAERGAAATLVLELADGVRRVPLASGATLGRDARNDVAIDHPTVSRQHARIERVGRAWQFVDLGSRNGTRGGVTAGLPFDLVHGAALRIGRVRAWFFDGDVPAGWTPPDAMPTDGKLVRCRCGHVGWAPSFVAGLAVKCRACKRPIAVADDIAPAVGVSTCAGCRDAVTLGQASHTCPSCQATMHADCYAELRGCATYGCDRVNELATTHDDVARVDTPQEIVSASGVGGDDRWTIALLALVGLPLFGGPAIAWAFFAAGRRKPWRAIAAAGVVGAIGFAASSLVWPKLLAEGGAAW